MITYDQPVKNLIAQLSATGHVTHTRYRKTSVTVHHNAGRQSHEGVLATWQTRPASAHFDIDAYGRPAQYVEVNEYAWAAGDTYGNQSSIHIEHCDQTLDPDWIVADVTWRAGARLTGYLFAHYIDGTPRPSPSNLFPHQHWYNTACPGPFLMKIWSQYMAEAQHWYDLFRGSKPPQPQTQGPVSTLQQALRITADGKWGPATDMVAMGMRNAASVRTFGRQVGNYDVRAVQHILGCTEDGVWGPVSQSKIGDWVGMVQGAVLRVLPDKVWGPKTDLAFMNLRSQNLNKY